MPDTIPRLRFAPSPTGPPHVGSLHTALFSWGLARALDGDFIVRIDDTDAARNSAESTPAMLDALRWLGLDWDEGPDIGGPHAPYYQSQRLARHQAVAQHLVAAGHAYRDGDGDGAVRLRLPRAGRTVLHDALRGAVVFDNRHFSDPVLLRSDGSALYHLANVVDDHDMGITHVVRGDDWLSGAVFAVQLYRALDWPEPIWLHLPLIVNRDGHKLSKRDPEGGYLAEDFMTAGYLPEALFNYLFLLGWSPDGEQELVDKWTVRRQLRIARLSASPAQFDWAKLNWLNQQYIRRLSLEALADQLRPFLEEAYGALPRAAWVTRLTALVRAELVTLADVVDSAEWAFDPPPAADPPAQAALHGDTARAVLTRLAAELTMIVLLDQPTAAAILSGLRQRTPHPPAAVFQPVRAALTGRVAGPPLADVMALLGRQRCLERLAAALRRADR